MDTLQDLELRGGTGSLNVHGIGRLQVTTLHNNDLHLEMASDVRRGLTAAQKMLPPKYFYDERGSQLFDAICNLPEYYLTRAERALLERVADDLIAAIQPTELFELGSGASHKTRLLLDAMQRSGLPLRYSPFDVSEEMLRASAAALLEAYPSLHIHAYVGDYDRSLGAVPSVPKRLVAFLGSTIGNFDHQQTAAFLRNMHGLCGRAGRLLIGVDLVKPVHRIEAAYNDTAGLTAAFNRNVLRVLNRELDADFEPNRFEHVAFYNRQLARIEMHLRARQRERVMIRALDMQVELRADETIHTEISRKFTRSEVEWMLRQSGFAAARWYEADDASFGLMLAVRAQQPVEKQAGERK